MATFLHKLVLASAMAVSVIAPASARTLIAVTFIAGQPYWASPQAIYHEAPLGQLQYGMHICANSDLVPWSYSQYRQFILPSGQTVYMEDHDDLNFGYTHNPADDKKCQANAAQYAQQSNPQYAQSFGSSALNDASRAQGAPVRPNVGVAVAADRLPSPASPPPPHGMTNAAYDVTPDEIIAAITAKWNHDDSDELADLKNKLQKAERDYSVCPNKAATECGFLTQERNSYGVTRRPGWYFGRGGPYDTQDSCAQFSVRYYCGNDFGAKYIKSDIANFTYRTNIYRFVSAQGKDYEGRIIAYVDIRRVQDDTVERYKAVLHQENNALVVERMDIVAQ